MIKIIDNAGKVLLETDQLSRATRLLNIYITNELEVTEEDELIYGDALYSEFTPPVKIHLDFKYKGIDDFNRPVFKCKDVGVYIGSVDKLITNEPVDYILEYFTANPNELCIFGTSFNCEPAGTGINSNIKVNLIK